MSKRQVCKQPSHPQFRSRQPRAAPSALAPKLCSAPGPAPAAPRPRLRWPRPLPLPFPALPPAQSIVGHKQSAPKQAGVSGAATAAAPSRTRARRRLPPNLPSPPLVPLPLPSPPRPENASRRRAASTAACLRPTAPNGRPLAPPLGAPASATGACLPPLRTLPARGHVAAARRHAPAAGCSRA